MTPAFNVTNRFSFSDEIKFKFGEQLSESSVESYQSD